MRLAALFLTVAVAACHPAAPHGHGPSAPTLNLQGNDTGAFMNNPHMRAFYELSKATLAGGAEGVDVAAYEQKSMALFKAFGASIGAPPGVMEDHLKLIPRQVIQIAREDPRVLDSYETFTEAMVGPP